MSPVVVRWAHVDDARSGARRLLRDAVAQVAGCSPGDVELHQSCPRCGGPHGRPTVEIAGRHGPEVSFAHAGDLAIVAVARAPVGVDIEPIGSPTHGIDLRVWVRTEAVLKATGFGLEIDPRLVDVGPATAPPRLVGWMGPGRRPALRMADVESAPGYLAALARLGRRPLRLDATAARVS